jgi:hypothetical protein
MAEPPFGLVGWSRFRAVLMLIHSTRRSDPVIWHESWQTLYSHHAVPMQQEFGAAGSLVLEE